MNFCGFTGRITKAPEVKTNNLGTPYCFFSIAVDGGKDKDGNKITDFIDCIVYKTQAEFMGKYVLKGSLLAVTGRLHVSLREDQEGNKTKRATVKVDEVNILAKPLGEGTQEKPKATETATPEAFDPDYSGELPFQI